MSEFLLQAFLEISAQRQPDAVALSMGNESLTYGALDQRSSQLARLLRESGAQRGDRIVVLMHKCPDAIMSFHGILKADCAYVPVDPSIPAARLKTILEACGATRILATDPAIKVLNEFSDGDPGFPIQIGWFGQKPAEQLHAAPSFRLADVLMLAPAAPAYRNHADDAAHILFTSGSTGTPKGVVITHANVEAFVRWGVNYFSIQPGDRNSGHSPLQFDLSTFDIYGVLAAGATLYPVPPELNLVPAKLADFIRANQLTQWFSAPAILNHMAKFDVVAQDDFPSLKRLMWCGEVFPTPALMYWMTRLPKVTFTNLYGPTEATIASSYYTVPQCPTDEKAAIPIGAPCAGESLYVLDDDLRHLPVGETGWLYIGGVGLSPGYWRDPEKTHGAFVTSPHLPDPHQRIYKTGDLAKFGADGLVYYLGRADSQIKCRGYRIELGEIETAANAIEGLRECAVVAIKTDSLEGTSICCAFVRGEKEFTPLLLRKELAKTLPVYMLPSRWLQFPVLPKNSNGKIDRPKLREHFQSAAAEVNAVTSNV